MLQHSSHNRIPLLTDAHVGSVKKVFQTDSWDSTTVLCYKEHTKGAKLFLQKYRNLECRPLIPGQGYQPIRYII